jgi:hypothetical protein
MLQVSFLLPADHGLDPKTTWVGLVQHMTGCLQCFPARLSAFKGQTLLAPSPLLLPSQHAAATSSSSSSGSSGQQQASSTDAAAAVQQSMQLQLVQLQESATSYVATIQLRDLQEDPGDDGARAIAARAGTVSSCSSSSSSSSGDPASNSSSSGSVTSVCSGLSAQPVAMVAGAFAAATSSAPTHEVVLSLAKPTGVVPFRLRLLHPVQASSAGRRLGWCTGGVWCSVCISCTPV